MSRESIMELLITEECISDDEKEIIEYGIRQLITIPLSIAAILVIGSLLGVFWQSVIFLFTFIPLRMYAGGYHADSQFRCFVISAIIVIISFCSLKYIVWSVLGSLILGLSSFIIIIFLAPVENDNKKLDELERLVYGIRTKVILVIESLILLASLYFRQSILFSTITMSFIIVSISLLAGNVKNKNFIRYRKNELH